VYTEPAGKDQQVQDRNSGELTGYVIEMENQKVPSSTKRFQWGIPAKIRGGGSNVLLRDPKGKIVARATVPVDPAPVPPDHGGFVLPSSAQSGSLVSVAVPATGDLGSTVSIGDQAVTVIAESPRKLVFLSPPDIAGSATLRVTKNGLSAETPFHGLGLQLSATKMALISGETATFTALVSGLQGSKEPTWVIITNRFPQVVNLSGGPLQAITIQPGDVRPDGTYQLARALTGEKGGMIDIEVVVTRSPASQVSLARLADCTIDRWSQANHIPISAEARALIQSGIVEAQPRLDDFLRSQMAWHADPTTLFDSMVRDYCFDLRDSMLRGSPISRRHISSQALLANSFLENPAAQASIAASDVRRFSFLQYLAQLLAHITPSQPVGHLRVTSQPENQRIKVDSFNGDAYFTTRTFVVSVGTHTVTVSACQETVSVSTNQTVAMSCPPQ
jgi:hypothetical protein